MASRTCSTCLRRARATATWCSASRSSLGPISIRRRCSFRIVSRSPFPILPAEVQRIGVTTKKQSPDIRWSSIWSHPMGRLIAFHQQLRAPPVRDELARVDGVGDIDVFGAREYSMRIWLDPHRASARGLTAQDVVQSISRNRTFRSPPASSARNRFRKGQRHFNILSAPRDGFADEDEFGEIVIKTGAERSGHSCRVTSLGSNWPRAITRSTASSAGSQRRRSASSNVPVPKRTGDFRCRARENG